MALLCDGNSPSGAVSEVIAALDRDQEWTWAGWVWSNITAPNFTALTLTSASSSSFNGVGRSNLVGGNFWAGRGNNGSADDSWASATFITTGTWVPLLLTKAAGENGAQTLYVGNTTGFAASNPRILWGDADPVVAAGGNTSGSGNVDLQLMPGKIAHFCVWQGVSDGILSTADIQQFMDGIQPDLISPSTVLWYRKLVGTLNEGVGSEDLTLQGNSSVDSENPIDEPVLVTQPDIVFGPILLQPEAGWRFNNYLNQPLPTDDFETPLPDPFNTIPSATLNQIIYEDTASAEGSPPGSRDGPTVIIDFNGGIFTDPVPIKPDAPHFQYHIYDNGTETWTLVATYTWQYEQGGEADDLAQTQALTSPTLGTANEIIADSLAQSQALEAPTIDAALIPAPDDSAQTQELESPTLSKENPEFEANDVSQSQALRSPSLGIPRIETAFVEQYDGPGGRAGARRSPPHTVRIKR